MTNRDELFSVLVIGANGGIGRALTEMLGANDAINHVDTLSRSEDGFDITDEASVEGAAASFGNERYDLIFNAVGALEISGDGPEKSFEQVNAANMARAFQINAIGAALVYKHFLPHLKRRGPARFATLSARVGSIGDNRLGGWMSYRASKAALNQITRCAAIEFARTNKDGVIVALHPGTVQTPLTEKYAKGRYTATPDECAQNLIRVMLTLTPQESGGFFDYSGEPVAW